MFIDIGQTPLLLTMLMSYPFDEKIVLLYGMNFGKSLHVLQETVALLDYKGWLDGCHT
jgi:hypothetical protein